MSKKYLGIVLVASLLLLGAGCQKSSSSSSANNNVGNSGGNNNNGSSANTITSRSLNTGTAGTDYEKIFEDTLEVDLPESPALGVESQIRPLLKKVFGQLKINSFGADFIGGGSLSVEYTMARAWSPNDLNTMSKILKDSGYSTSMMNNTNGVSSGLFQGKDYDLYIGGQGQVVSVTYSPRQ